MTNSITYKQRLLARIIFEADTPIKVGSGASGNLLTDSPVATDVNGLPYIPATSMAGVLRHMIGEDEAKTFFGDPDKRNPHGSKIIFTEAKLIGKDGRAIDGLGMDIDWQDPDPFYVNYFNLPIRQHTRLGDRGCVADAGKFDEQVVYKGSRFCFEVEMLSDGDDAEKFDEVLRGIHSDAFKLGGGSTRGFGEVKVISCKTKVLDLTKAEDRKLYAAKSSDLSKDWDCGEASTNVHGQGVKDGILYTLKLQPEDFFFFGSGHGDDATDMAPVKEKVVTWADGRPTFSEEQVLVPATSVKGAISHRVAYHYNKRSGCTIGSGNGKTMAENLAVQELFGYADLRGESKKGTVEISDIFVDKQLPDRVAPHVAIDRFTGGSMDGALYSEKTVYGKGQEMILRVICRRADFDENVLESLEDTLEDICKGLLPLGGGVNRGNGTFKGSLTKNGETLYENN